MDGAGFSVDGIHSSVDCGLSSVDGTSLLPWMGPASVDRTPPSVDGTSPSVDRILASVDGTFLRG